jgi:hypothetical protein
LTLVALSGCGSDETLSPPEPATTSSNPSQTTAEQVPGDAGLVDLCGALWALLEAPGMAERVCALQATDPSAPEAIQQCKLCAAGINFAEQLLPNPVCQTQLEDCPVGDAQLAACFETIGEVLTEVVPGCEPDATNPVDTAALGLRIATSSCAPVLLECKPMQNLVVALLGST